MSTTNNPIVDAEPYQDAVAKLWDYLSLPYTPFFKKHSELRACASLIAKWKINIEKKTADKAVCLIDTVYDFIRDLNASEISSVDKIRSMADFFNVDQERIIKVFGSDESSEVDRGLLYLETKIRGLKI